MSNKIKKLLSVMRQLRHPETGCPWDRKQTYESIAPYTIEEAYEVEDAVERKDIDALKSELGDLLFQVVFYSQIANEDGEFSFDDVVETITEKMVERHPHVFSNETFHNAEGQTNNWEAHKQEERSRKAALEKRSISILDDVPKNLPALVRAKKLTKRAATVGFDWSQTDQVVAKIDEELAEVKAEINANTSQTCLEDEIGDLLFTVANLARHYKIDPETALKKTNRKFIDRFHFIERKLEAADMSFEDASLELMEEHWQTAKTVPLKID
ncbi:MAG: nucleoside triphosphate pyrophosphohydrolase [Pseudomonadota bacterium]|nr:nucleoside triphosphate pyrophosphohydrolase [Pseudomonadota bacterium]